MKLKIILFKKKKNGKYLKFRKDFDLDNILESFEYLDELDVLDNNFYYVFKLNNNNLSKQGIIFKFGNLNSLYFIPIKKYNHFIKQMGIAMYNLLTHTHQKKLYLSDN